MKKYFIVAAALIITVVAGIVVFSAIPKQKESGTVNNTNNSAKDAPSDNQNQGEQPSQQATPTVQRTDEELNAAMTKSAPSLINKSTGKPIYTIVKKESPLTGWYIVTIRNNESYTSDANVVMTDTNGKLTIKAGPGTGLFNQPGLPQAVVDALKAQ